MAKYKNLTELAEGFKNGELENWILMLDNDSTYLSWDGPWPDDETLDEFEESKSDKGEELYNGSDDVYILDQALALAGIPNKNV